MSDPFSSLASSGYGNQIRGYPQATSVLATDAFLIDRLGIGTMFVEAGVFITSIYDVAMCFPGPPPASSTVFVFTAVRPITLPEAMVGSEFSLQDAPTSALSFGIQKNGTAIGSVSFSNGSVIGTPALAAPASFVAGDELRVTTPASTFGASDLSMTFAFSLG
jgi:hypothetical protein